MEMNMKRKGMEMKHTCEHSQINLCVPTLSFLPPHILLPFFSHSFILHVSSPHPPTPAPVSPVEHGSGGVTDVLMWLRFLITTQLKAPFALVRCDRWEAEAEWRGDAMLTNGSGGISEAEEVEGGGGHDEDDTHCWKW